MADVGLKNRIRDALRASFNEPDDVIDVADSDATDDLVHLVVVSRRFEGKGPLDNADLIWDELERRLTPDEWGKVSLTVGATPAELNGAAAADLKYV